MLFSHPGVDTYYCIDRRYEIHESYDDGACQRHEREHSKITDLDKEIAVSSVSKLGPKGEDIDFKPIFT